MNDFKLMQEVHHLIDRRVGFAMTVTRLPPKAIDKIFAQVERPLGKFEYYPQFNLAPLISVSKAWKTIAERRLYRSISIGSDFEAGGYFYDEGVGGGGGLENGGEYQDPFFRSGEEIASFLHRTLEENPRLASLVNELRLATMSHIRSETKNHIAILKLCKNAQDVEILGYNGYELVDLQDVLRARSIRSLTVSRYGLRSMEGSGFCSLRQLLAMMAGWPRLTKMYLYPHTLTMDCEEEKLVLPEPRCCPGLQTVILREEWLGRKELQVLLTMTSCVRELDVKLVRGDNEETNGVLVDCLETWAPTLQHVILASYDYKPTDHSFSRMARVKKPHASSLLVRPSSLQHHPYLRNLSYAATNSEIEEFMSLLESTMAFLALKRLDIWSLEIYAGSYTRKRVKLSKMLFLKLERVCLARKIKLNGFLIDYE